MVQSWGEQVYIQSLIGLVFHIPPANLINIEVVETALYVAATAQGKAFGSALLQTLIVDAEKTI